MKLTNLASTILTTLTLLVASLVVSVTPAWAGTNLTVNCGSGGSCSISPASTPLFNEGGWLPGTHQTQYLRITNNSGTNAWVAIDAESYSETNAVGQVISLEIRRGSASGPVIYSVPNLHVFNADGYFTFDTLSTGQTTDYFVTASMLPSAGNQYQNSQVGFDLRLGLELTSQPPTSGGGDGGGGEVSGTSAASAPVCTATPPSPAPALSVVTTGDNTVSLSWTAVSPVTHYALAFTSSGGAQYGSPNVGNVTTYTVSNLSGGDTYTFEVFGVNDCAPGPRSSQTSPTVSGPVVTGNPVGPGGEVLGVEEGSEGTTEAGEENGRLGEVAGTLSEACAQWGFYLPWILLVVQLLVILLAETYFRHSHAWTKHFVTIGVTLVSIALFYWLRTCDCYAARSFLSWLCQWYWVVALLVAGLGRGISYAFIEDSDAKEWERQLKTMTGTPSSQTDEENVTPTQFTGAKPETTATSSLTPEAEKPSNYA